MSVTNHSIRAAKLVQCKRLVRKGYAVAEAAEKLGLPVESTRARCAEEGWIADRLDYKELAAPIDLASDRDIHARRVYDLVRVGLERLEREVSLEVGKFAQALDILDKVGRRVLGMDSASGNVNVSVLTSAAIINTSPPDS